MKKLVYIHGFNSSPQSEKARLTRDYFKNYSNTFDVEIASFPPQPAEAISALQNLVDDIGPQNVAGFVGSSLGGYYSVYLHTVYQLPAVLINPALRPYELLSDYLGLNENLYTGERYLVTEQHMHELKQLDVIERVNQGLIYLLTQTGDEVLDYYQAASMLPHARSWIIAGGDHAFQGFEVCLPSIEGFFCARASQA